MVALKHIQWRESAYRFLKERPDEEFTARQLLGYVKRPNGKDYAQVPYANAVGQLLRLDGRFQYRETSFHPESDAVYHRRQSRVYWVTEEEE
jgi:hypothetical protein